MNIILYLIVLIVCAVIAGAVSYYAVKYKNESTQDYINDLFINPSNSASITFWIILLVTFFGFIFYRYKTNNS